MTLAIAESINFRCHLRRHGTDKLEGHDPFVLLRHRRANCCIQLVQQLLRLY